MTTSAGPRTVGVAVAIPEPHGQRLQQWRQRFGDPLAGYIPPHVTLVPPVHLADEDFVEVEEHLARVAGSERPFSILLRGTGTFRPVSPVVFVALARGISDCERLAGRIRQGPLACELSFPYHPHVTVAHELPEPALDRAFAELADYEARFSVWGFALYEHGSDGVWRPWREYRFPRMPEES